MYVLLTTEITEVECLERKETRRRICVLVKSELRQESL